LRFPRDHRHHRSHRDTNEKKHRHSSPKRSKSPETKRRKNEDEKIKKTNDDDIEEGETTNNNETNGTTTAAVPKRVPLSLEEMLERNKKEQEAIAKVKYSVIRITNTFFFVCLAQVFNETRT
jgi:hypothetical protein